MEDSNMSSSEDVTSSSESTDSVEYVRPNYSYLKRTMANFKKVDLLPSIDAIQTDVSVNLRGNQQNFTKKKLIELIIQEISQLGYNLFSYAESLDLIQIQLYSSKLKWDAYHLDQLVDNSLLRRQCKVFEISLEKVLNNTDFFKGLKCKMFKEGIWCRIPLKSKLLRNVQTVKCVYLVFFPGLPFLMMAKLRKGNMQNSLIRVLKTVFRAGKLEPMYLFSNDVSALLQLAIQKQNQALIKDAKNAPAIIREKMTINVNQYPEIENIIDLDKDGTEEKKSYTRKIFGKYKQPAIKKLAFLSKTNFHGFQDDSNFDDSLKLRCEMGFAGENVLQGIREMVQIGVFSHPLPNYIENLPLFGHNTVKLTD